RRDNPLYCENFTSHGCNCAGGFAEFVAVKAAKCFKINNLSYRQAVMVEPTSCAIHGMDVIAVKPGSEVLVFGAGPTGLILAQLAKLNGAAKLVVAAPAGAKLELAKSFGADEIIEIDREDYSAHRKAIKNRYPAGFDTVVEATGVAELLQESIDYLKMGGPAIAYGVYSQDAKITLSPYDIFARELTVKGSFAQTHCFDRALLYLESGAVNIDPLVTHELPLKDYGLALDMMRRKEGIKIAIVPG
ncbi:MAG TPA: chlorophyll synthesis pathway protein BchC, partial [Phycisphaerae bacterium]|nr:chlorophyll synthesis pathway protein BchC [Phycisphaerae bacterium]